MPLIQWPPTYSPASEYEQLGIVLLLFKMQKPSYHLSHIHS
jgi:hypothetical protein